MGDSNPSSGMGISFACGMAYGGTSVAVGQPFDTVKTRMQAGASSRHHTALQALKEITAREGVRGLYRGGVPLFVGGALFRSTQFGFYHNAHAFLKRNTPEHRLFGVLDYQVVLAGFCGGFGRGLVEGPFEFIKVRRQVEQKWTFRELVRDIGEGSAATMARNAFLFMSFAVYCDLSKTLIEGGLSPFWTGAICANLAWMTVWPMDVVKSQVQSGNYRGKSVAFLLADTFRTGKIFRGLLPGLSRSTVANGSGMVVYKKVEKYLVEDGRR